jgi:DNA-binding transcriptional regulator YiaG
MTKRNTTISKRPSKSNAVGRELLAAVKQMHDAVVTGDMTGFRVREVEIPAPEQYGPKQVRRLRDALGVTQRTFARLLGVSPELVEHWEQGRRTPVPIACRLLDRISADPRQFVADLMKTRKVAG